MADSVSPDVKIAILGCRLERACGRYSEAGLFLVGLTPVEPADGYSLAIEHGINQIRQGYVGNAVGILRSEHEKIMQQGKKRTSPAQALLLLLYRYARLKMGDIPGDALEVCDNIWARHLGNRLLQDFDYISVTLELYWHLTVSIFLRASGRSEFGCGNDQTKDRLTKIASYLHKEDRDDEAIEVLLVQRALWGSTSMQLPIAALSGIALGYAYLLLGDTAESATTFTATDHAHGSLDVKSHILKRNMSQQKLDTTAVEAFGLIDGFQRIDYAAGVMRVLRLLITAYRSKNCRLPHEIEQLVGFWERRTGAAIMLLSDPFIAFEKYSSSFSGSSPELPRHVVAGLPQSVNMSMQSLSLQTSWAPQHMSQAPLPFTQQRAQQRSLPQTPLSPLPIPFSPLEAPFSLERRPTSLQKSPVTVQNIILKSPPQERSLLLPKSPPQSPKNRDSSPDRAHEPKPSPISTETQPAQLIFDNCSVASSSSEDSLYAQPPKTVSLNALERHSPEPQPHQRPPSQPKVVEHSSAQHGPQEHLSSQHHGQGDCLSQPQTNGQPTGAESAVDVQSSNVTLAPPIIASPPSLSRSERKQWFEDMFRALPPVEQQGIGQKDRRKSQGIRSIFSGMPLKDGYSTHTNNTSKSDHTAKTSNSEPPAKGRRRFTLTSPLKRKKSDPVIEAVKEDDDKVDPIGLVILAEELRVKAMTEYQTEKAFELAARKLGMASIYKAVASWYLEGPRSLIHNCDEALNWLYCAEQTDVEGSVNTVHEMRALGTIMIRFGDGMGCFAVDPSQQDVSDLFVLRNEALHRAYNRMDAAVHASFVVLGTIDIILGNEQEARSWLRQAKEAAQHFDRSHLMNKSVMVTAATRAGIALKLRDNRFLANCEPLEAQEAGSLRVMLDSFELKQTSGGSISRDVELMAVGHYFLGYTKLEKNFQTDADAEGLRSARTSFEAGVNLLKNFNMKKRRYAYINCICGLYTTYIREATMLKDCESLKKGFRYLHGLACAMEDLRVGQWAASGEEHERQRLSEIEIWKRLAKDGFHVLLLGLNLSLEQRNNENWNHFAMSTWVWVQLVKAREFAGQLSLVTYFFEAPIAEVSPKAQQYLGSEKHLVQMVEETPIVRGTEVRQELRKLRKEMMQDPALSTERTAFNGQARLSEIQAHPVFQDIFYVDYFTDGGGNVLYSVMAVTTPISSLSQTKHEVRIGTTGLTINDIGRWCGRHLNKGTMIHPFNGFNALDELIPLVSGLRGVIERGKLVVLCPTGQLCRIPLHAVRISDTQCLIERNPVVYTSTLHSSMHCVRNRKQLVSWRDISKLPGVAVRSNGAARSPRSPTSPSSARYSSFDAETSSSDLSYEVEGKRILLLSGKAVGTGGRGSEAVIEVPSSTDGPGTRLTDDLIRSWKLRSNPLVFALSHQGESEDLMRALDPMALPTSLLLAGAQSVVGSLWPGFERDNDVFTSIFNKQLGEFAQSGAFMVDLAYLMQKTVVGMMQDQERNAPYYWASFALFGSWRLLFHALG